MARYGGLSLSNVIDLYFKRIRFLGVHCGKPGITLRPAHRAIQHRFRATSALIAKLNPATYFKDLPESSMLTTAMPKMSAVLRIKAELALTEASRTLVSQQASLGTSPETRAYADTASVVRKELDKLVNILADDGSEKHWNVAARVAKCADYLAQIPSLEVQDARLEMIAAHKVLRDVQEITL